MQGFFGDNEHVLKLANDDCTDLEETRNHGILHFRKVNVVFISYQ